MERHPRVVLVPGLRELEGLTTLTAGLEAQGNAFKRGQSPPLRKRGCVLSWLPLLTLSRL